MLFCPVTTESRLINIIIDDRRIMVNINNCTFELAINWCDWPNFRRWQSTTCKFRLGASCLENTQSDQLPHLRAKTASLASPWVGSTLSPDQRWITGLHRFAEISIREGHSRWRAPKPAAYAHSRWTWRTSDRFSVAATTICLWCGDRSYLKEDAIR